MDWKTIDRQLLKDGWSHLKGRGKGGHRLYKKDGKMIVLPTSSKQISPGVIRTIEKQSGRKFRG